MRITVLVFRVLDLGKLLIGIRKEEKKLVQPPLDSTPY